MNGRIPALDGLRGLCVLGVLLVHAGVPFVRGGFLGVDGFFVLSGYLITSLLLREHDRTGRIDLGAFYTRRALRLLPALFLLLAFVGAWLVVAQPRPVLVADTWRGIWSSVLYVSNWAKIITPSGADADLGLLNHTWSLAIEEQFYILWPPLLVWLLRRSPRRVPYLLGAAALASALWRAALFLGGAAPGSYRVYGATDARADSILLGCLIAVLLFSGVLRPNVRYTRLAALLAVPVVLVLWALVPVISPVPYLGGLTLNALLMAALILHLRASPVGRVARALSWKPLAAVGVVSYGLYLWHYPLLAMLPAASWADWPMQATRLVTIVLCVFASYRYIEQPFLRLKPRPAPSHAPRAA